MVLAHEVGIDSEKAYQRSDLLDHHRLLMGTGPPIVALREAGSAAFVLPSHGFQQLAPFEALFGWS
jgi:hypothetical protein